MSMSSGISASALLQRRTITSPTSGLPISYVECLGRPSPSPPSLATPTLLIHGLDSSSHTWRGVQRSLPSPSVAVDCRGCGKSDLGDPDAFSPDALVDDIHCVVNSHLWLKDRRFVLVGHSMGGRIAMCYAAAHPDNVAALVVEDMDTLRRSVGSNFIPNFDEAKAIEFGKKHADLESIRKGLADIGYPSDMIEKWIGEGRIYEEADAYWSDVHPAFRGLCYRTIFDSDSGTESWAKVARYFNRKKHDEPSMNIHVMVAGIGTVCNEKSLKHMRETMKVSGDAGGIAPTVKTYGEGTHSIHNSAREEFMSDLERIVEEAAAAEAG